MVPVKVTTVETDSMSRAQQYVGTIEADKSVTLSFETGGLIRNIYVKEGQKVQKGELLAELDDRTARNAYQAAKVTLEQAEDGYKRAESVYKKGSLPEVKWVEIQTQLNQAKSMADICLKNVENCKMYATQSGTIGNKAIAKPMATTTTGIATYVWIITKEKPVSHREHVLLIDASKCFEQRRKPIGNKRVEAGDNVMPFQPVMQLLDMGKISVKVYIPEKEIAQTRVGQRARIYVTAMDTSFKGCIREIGVIADPLSHAYPVSIVLDRVPSNLLPGMVCKVDIQNGSHYEVGIEVPANAVQLGNDGRSFVWVADGEKAHKCYVTTGDFTAKGVWITEGLQQGDKVIVEGFHKICEETRIKIQ